MGVDSGLSICSSLWIGNRMDAFIPIDKLSQAIKDYPYYTPESPVILENTNDPGLNWGRTLDIIRMLKDDHGHTGAINFITKMGVSEKRAQQFAQVVEEGAKVIATVTYAGLPSEIEPASAQARINTMQRFHNVGIPVIMSMRPMIEGINCEQSDIERVLESVNGKVDIVTVGGLFIYNFTREAFSEAGYPLEANMYDTRYAAAKVNPSGIKEKVRAAARNAGFQGTIQSHNSCAISQVMTTHYATPTYDRIAHWQAPSGETRIDDYCAEFCPPQQMEVCQDKIDSDLHTSVVGAYNALFRVIEGQKKAGKNPPDMSITRSVEFPNMLLVKNGSLLIEELFLLEEKSGLDVNNLPTEEGLRYRTNQAISIDMGLNFDEVYKGEIQIGQEWYVLVNGIVDNDDNNTLTRWIRGRNRARINILDINDIDSDEDFAQMVNHLSGRSFGMQTAEEIASQLSVIKSQWQSHE